MRVTHKNKNKDNYEENVLYDLKHLIYHILNCFSLEDILK